MGIQRLWKKNSSKIPVPQLNHTGQGALRRRRRAPPQSAPIRRGPSACSGPLLPNHPALLPPASPVGTASSAACLQRRCLSPGARRWVGRSSPSHGRRSRRTPSPSYPAVRNLPSSSSLFGLLFPFFQFRPIGSLRSYSGCQTSFCYVILLLDCVA